MGNPPANETVAYNDRLSCPEKLYKYFSYDGLVKTLESQSVKLSRSTDFNDPLDLYVQEALGMDEVNFLDGLKSAFCDFVSGDIDYGSLPESPYKSKVVILNQAIRADPDIREQIKREVIATPVADMYDIEKMRNMMHDVVKIFNKLFQNDGIFCSTVDPNNLLMWAHYADQHRGAVVGLTPSIKKDSALLVSRGVHYTNIRPFLYDHPITMITRAVTMAPKEAVDQIFDRLIYTKSAEWEYEKEYRLHIPRFIPDDEQYSTLHFHPEELTALCLGCRMEEENRKRSVELARKINPIVEVLEARIVPREFRLEYIEKPMCNLHAE